jgi:ankyrin repeat protein
MIISTVTIAENEHNLSTLDASIRDSIFNAVKANDVNTVKEWLDAGGNVNAVDKWGQNILLRACIDNAYDVAKLSLEYDAEINCLDYNNNTPLMMATYANNIQLIQFLLMNGADLNAVNCAGKSSLHEAVKFNYIETTKALVESGAEIESRDTLYQTPIFYALSPDHIEILELLINSGANIFATDINGRTLLHAAASINNTEAIELLIEHGLDIKAEDNKGLTPLEYAWSCDYIIAPFGRCFDFMSDRYTRIYSWSGYEAFRLLIQHGADITRIDWRKPEQLIRLVQYDAPDLVLIALENGASVNAKDSDFLRTPLHQSAAFNTVENARLLIEKGAVIDIENNNGETPLITAIQYKSIDVASLLIEFGADIIFLTEPPDSSVMPIWGWEFWNIHRPIEWAVSRNSPEIVNLLIGAGVGISKETVSNNSLLHYASRFNYQEIITLLIQAGINVDTKDSSGRTPLYLVVNNRPVRYEAARILLEHGADPNFYYNSETLLHTAVTEQDTILASLLIDFGANVNTVNRIGFTPLFYAVFIDNVSIASRLISNGADPFVIDRGGSGLLHYASRYLSYETAKLLIEAGLDVNSKDNNGYTPIFWLNNEQSYRDRVRNNSRSEAFAKLLVENGADWDISAMGKSLFETVFSRNCYPFASWLYDQGVDYHCYDKNGYNLLMRFASSMNQNAETVKLLLEYGENPNAFNNFHETALLLASKQHSYWQVNPELFKALIENGADVNLADTLNQTPLYHLVYNNHEEAVELLLQAGADPNIANLNGRVPIHHSTSSRDVKITGLLLKYGANLDIRKPYQNKTSLHVAAQDCYFDIAELLLEYGADPNILDDNGNTPLHFAANGSSFPYERGRVIKALLSHGADANKRNKNDEIPLDFARKHKLKEIITLLEENNQE